MKFISFVHQGQPTYGSWQAEEAWVRVPATFQQQYPDLKAVLAAGKLSELEAAMYAGGVAIDVSQARLLPVMPNPGKIFCVGLNYKTHVAETKRSESEFPAIFTRFADSLTAHNGEFPHPKETSRFDFEGELAVIIGTGGRNITQVRIPAIVTADSGRS